MADEILSTYQQMIDSADSYAKQQSDIQNQMTEQTINEINQNKDRTERDYVREQKGSYADYQREIDKYGANGEQIVSSGLAGSGYQESTKVNAFNTWQNRIMVARDSFNQAMTDYNNQIANARLQNSAKQAEIAQQALQQRLSVTLQMLQYQQAQEKARASAGGSYNGGTNNNYTFNTNGGNYADEKTYADYQANNNRFAIDDNGTTGGSTHSSAVNFGTSSGSNKNAIDVAGTVAIAKAIDEANKNKPTTYNVTNAVNNVVNTIKANAGFDPTMGGRIEIPTTTSSKTSSTSYTNNNKTNTTNKKVTK